MSGVEVRAVAHPNIAVVKYWGKRDAALNLPAVSSVSLTLEPFRTETVLRWGAHADALWLDGAAATDADAARAFRFLDLAAPGRPPVRIDSRNGFPTGAGLASSASGFAALALAISRAAGLDEDRVAVSRLARRGSGSACRSLWGGWVHWARGEAGDGTDSHGRPVTGPVDVAMLVAIVDEGRKAIGSTEAMLRSSRTSPAWPSWIDASEGWVRDALTALAASDLPAVGAVMERSTLLMHAMAWTSNPPIVYWRPATLALWHAVSNLRAEGVGAWATMDAGPQVKVLTAAQDAETVAAALAPHALRVVRCAPGPDASVT